MFVHIQTALLSTRTIRGKLNSIFDTFSKRAMNRPRIFDSYGEISIGFHQGNPVLVHYQAELLSVSDLKTLSEISRATFQLPIVDISIIKNNPTEDLKFIVITEDRNAHSISLNGKVFKVHSSTSLGENNIMMSHVVLTDKRNYSYVLFENGSVIKLSKKSPENFQVSFPNPNARIRRLVPTVPFDGQHLVAPNSAAFFAFQKTDNGCEIASLIFNFDRKKIIEGPYNISISPHSWFLNSRFFYQNQKLFCINPYKEVDTFNDIFCCSTSTLNSEQITFFTAVGIGYTVTINGDSTDVKEIMRMPKPPVRVEACGDDFVFLTYDGNLVSKNSGASLKIPVPFRMSEYKSILIRCTEHEIKPFPLSPSPPPKIINASVKNDIVKSSTGAEWKAPGKIVAYSSYPSSNSDFLIAATSASIHILDLSNTSKKVTLIKEEVFNSPVIAVAISAVHYAVSTVDSGVQVSSYVGEPFNLTFHTGQCLCLSLSATTVASGFDDGSFILASLEERGPLINVKPFNVPVKSVQHNDDMSAVVEWCEAVALVSRQSIKWLKLPTFNGAMVSAFAADLLALGGANGLSIYNFPTNKLAAVIPKRVVGVCSSSVCFSTLGSLGIRFFALTVNNELVVLYSHREIDVDHQSIIDAEDPLALYAVDENAYVLCNRYVAIYDMRGNRIDTVEFSVPPRFFGAAARGFYVAFSRMVWYISRDQSMKRIPHDKSNITGFSAIDDERFCISTNSRILVCESIGSKVSFNTLVKIDKKVLSMKAFASKQTGVVDSLLVVFDDNSNEIYNLPASISNQ